MLIDQLPLLQRNAVVREIASTYVRYKVMPSHPLGDALHLALASHYRCDYLLTWNFKHLANANKVRAHSTSERLARPLRSEDCHAVRATGEGTMRKHEDPDPLIDEIYEIRKKISREHGDDLDRLLDHYAEYERQFSDRLISTPPPGPAKQGKSAA
jgi:hypothetical protein